ncbi:MAG: PD40 domain-containing protein [Phycisphaerae bacterium]|nr:PD40 domain-containing protein [Phycisphaerae bacterium]
MKALGIISLTAAGAAALALVALLAARHASSFWTDAGAIKQPAEAPVRSILWLPSRPIAGVNSAVDEYEPRYSPDATLMVMVRRKPGHNADLFMSRWSPAGWSTPESIASINTDADELGPEISADGESLYFYSDRAGGKGGYDLWVARRDDDRWSTPRNLGDAINTEFNEYAPALTPDRRTLYFSSDRPRAGEEPPAPTPWDATMRQRHARHDYDLYQSDLHDDLAERARPLDWANTTRDEGAPAVSPAGDFLYFSSDRAGGLGGYDLYRARLNDPRHHTIENLGDAVNSRDNELDPGLSADGFRLTFSSDRSLPEEAVPPTSPGAPTAPSAAPSVTPTTVDAAHLAASNSGPSPARAERDYNLWSTASREVFLDYGPLGATLAAWLDAAWPWILLLLLASLLLWLLSRLLASEVWRRRFAQMSLLARCLLVSLVIHALIASLLTIWRVGTYLGEMMNSGGTRVILASSADLSSDITSQFTSAIESPDAPRLESAPLELPRAELSEPATSISLESREHTDTPSASLQRADLPTPIDPAVAPRNPQPIALAPDTGVEARLPASPAPAASRPEAIPTRPSLAPAAPSERAELSADLGAPSLISRAPVDPASPADAAIANTPSESRVPARDVAAPERSHPVPDASPAVDTPLPSIDRQSRIAEASPSTTAPELSPAGVRSPAETIEAPTTSTPLAARPTPTDDSPLPDLALTTPILAPADSAVAPAYLEQTALAPREPRTPDIEIPLPVAPGPARSREPETSPTPIAPLLDAPRPASGSFIAPPSLPPALLAPPTLTRRESRDTPGALAPAPITPSPAPAPDASPMPDLARSLAPQARDPLPTLPPELPQPVEDFAQRTFEQRSELVEQMGGSQETEQAVARSLEWLRRAQEPDGRWSSKNHGGEVNADTAMTGLALLCFLSAGHTHTIDGPYRDSVARAIDHLTSRQRPDGNLAPDETMYGQTIAGVALCEAYAMTRDARLARPVKLAVEFVDASARSNDGSAGATSVLGWQVMAMESARRAGVKTSNITFDAARRWLDSVANPRSPGRYAYQRAQAPSPAMTAEAMFVQQLLGRGSGEARMQDSARFILGTMPRWQDGAPTHYWYYATLALFQHQGQAWTTWNDALVPELLAHQHTDGALAGSWDPMDRWSKLCGRVHQTAICTLSLEVYYRYKTRPAPAAPEELTRGADNARAE